MSWLDDESMQIATYGWKKFEGIEVSGRSLYYTTRTMPKLYALSYNDWDFDLIPEEQFQRILAEAKSQIAMQVPPEHTLTPKQLMQSIRDTLREVLGPLPDSTT